MEATSRPKRNGAARGVRSKVLGIKQLKRQRLRVVAESPPDVPRPRTRPECIGTDRPCPWVSCKHHLYLDVNPETGAIKLNFPDLEVWELDETCALDVAGQGGLTLEEVGTVMNLTRERVRQVEAIALRKLKAAVRAVSPEEAQ